ncbi:MAG: hypothetical protein WB239_15065 [Acidimicrobiia bacterium]
MSILRRMAGPLVVVWALLVPMPAMAHGIGGRLDLPVPVSYFAIGAALVVALSFALLAALWPRPRLQDGPRYGAWRAPWLRYVTGLARVVGVLSLLLVLGAGLAEWLAGAEGTTIAPVLVWVVFWLVVPFSSAVLGDTYTVLNPWRTVAAATRLGNEERPGMSRRWGVWPATFLFFGFAWMELIFPHSESPLALAGAALLYTAVLLTVIAIAGRDTGLGSWDMFTVYNRLFSSVSPLGRVEGQPRRRGWLRALVVLPEWPGLWAFVVMTIGTVSYDGLKAASWWPGWGMAAQTAAMGGIVLVLGGAYLGASTVANRMTGGASTTLKVAQRFAHTLVPIGMAYAVAHYFTLVIFEGQQLLSTLSDPFGLGWDLFGTAARKVDFFIRRPEPIWYLQVGVIVTGHVTGVVLAHDRALADFEGAAAVRSQYAMLVLMVLLTSLGLVILAG